MCSITNYEPNEDKIVEYAKWLGIDKQIYI